MPCQSSGGLHEWVRLRSRHTQKVMANRRLLLFRKQVKNSRQSDTILENSPKGDSQSNGEAENAVREAEGMIRTWKMYNEVEGSDRQQACATSVARDARRSDHHEVQNSPRWPDRVLFRRKRSLTDLFFESITK